MKSTQIMKNHPSSPVSTPTIHSLPPGGHSQGKQVGINMYAQQKNIHIMVKFITMNASTHSKTVLTRMNLQNFL